MGTKGKVGLFLLGACAVVPLASASYRWHRRGSDPRPSPAAKVNANAVEMASTVVIVGAGITGLTAASELGNRGIDVLVVDAWSVYGGHGIQSGGGLAIVDTPVQRARGINDSRELARRDFLEWGGDNDTYWADEYARTSSSEIYD